MSQDSLKPPGGGRTLITAAILAVVVAAALVFLSGCSTGHDDWVPVTNLLKDHYGGRK